MDGDVISTSIAPVVENKDDDDIDWPWISKHNIILYEFILN